MYTHPLWSTFPLPQYIYIYNCIHGSAQCLYLHCSSILSMFNRRLKVDTVWRSYLGKEAVLRTPLSLATWNRPRRKECHGDIRRPAIIANSLGCKTKQIGKRSIRKRRVSSLTWGTCVVCPRHSLRESSPSTGRMLDFVVNSLCLIASWGQQTQRGWQRQPSKHFQAVSFFCL